MDCGLTRIGTGHLKTWRGSLSVWEDIERGGPDAEPRQDVGGNATATTRDDPGSVLKRLAESQKSALSYPFRHPTKTIIK